MKSATGLKQMGKQILDTVSSGNLDDAMALFKNSISRQYIPSEKVLGVLHSNLLKANRTSEVEFIEAQFTEFNIPKRSPFYASKIQHAFHQKDTVQVEKLFKELSSNNILETYLFNQFLSHFDKLKDYKKTLVLLNSIDKSKIKFNSYTYDMIIKIACEFQLPDMIHMYYKQMMEDKITPNIFIFVNILKYYQKKPNFGEAKFFYLEATRHCDPDEYEFITIVDIFAQIASRSIGFEHVLEFDHFAIFFSAYLKTNFLGLQHFIKFNQTEEVLFHLVRHFTKIGNIDLARKYAELPAAQTDDVQYFLVDYFYRVENYDSMMAEFKKISKPSRSLINILAQKLISSGSPLISELPQDKIKEMMAIYNDNEYFMKMAEKIPHDETSINNAILDRMVNINFHKAMELYPKIPYHSKVTVSIMLKGYMAQHNTMKLLKFYQNTPANYRVSLEVVKYLVERHEYNLKKVLSELEDLQLLHTLSKSAWAYLISFSIRKQIDPTRLYILMIKHKKEPNTVIFNLMVEYYCQSGQIDKAIGILKMTRDFGEVVPSKRIYLMLMKYYLDRDMKEDAQKIYQMANKVLGEQLEK